MKGLACDKFESVLPASFWLVSFTMFCELSVTLVDCSFLIVFSHTCTQEGVSGMLMSS